MELLTYPVGLVIGLLPVVANLGPPGSAPAQLLLDGRPACAMTAEAPECTVDLGPELHVHLLELVRTDGRGAVVERSIRWVNGPGAQAEVYIRGACDQSSGECTASIGWGHPGKLDPRAMVVTLDGKPILREVRHEVRFRAAPGSDGVVSVDVIFPDGRRASQVRALGAGYAGFAEASLQPIPVVPAGAVAAPQTIGGRPVRGVEDAGVEVAFVVEPGALEGLLRPATVEETDLLGPRVKAADPRRLRAGDRLSDAERVTAIIPNSTLNRFEIVPARDWLPHVEYGAAALGGNRMRLADAVASAGMLVAGAPHKRVVVLAISGHSRDESAFTPEQVRRYLSEIMVPLVVWRTRAGIGAGWPEGPRITPATFLAAVESMRASVAAQRVAWVEGPLNPASIRLRDDERGFAISGRSGAPPQVVAAAAPAAEEAGPTASPPAQITAPGRRVRGTVDVTVVRVQIRPLARDGTPVRDLRAEEITVREDGAPARVLGIDRIETAAEAARVEPGAATTPATPAPHPRPWSFTFYIVPDFCTPAGLSRILDRVRVEATRLVALGRVRIVVADPEPRVLGQQVPDAATLERLLADGRLRRLAPSRIAQVRRDFLNTVSAIDSRPSLGGPGGSPPGSLSAVETAQVALFRAKIAQARVAFAEERSILRGMISRLVAWSRLESSTDARVLFLAIDGFDLRPEGFYLAMFEPDPQSYLEVALYRQVSEEFSAQRLGPVVEEAAAALAERGMAVVTFDNGVAALAGLTTGAEFSGHGRLTAFNRAKASATGASFLFMNPRDPLQTMADTSGGLVVPPAGSMGKTLDVLGDTLLLAYQVERPPDGKAHKIEIGTARPGVEIAAPSLIFSGTPEGESEMRARRVLEGTEQAGELSVRLAVAPENGAEKGWTTGTLEVRAVLGPLRPVLESIGTARLRLTVAVELVDSEPFVTHQLHGWDPRASETWVCQAPIRWPEGAKRAAVVVEELATGAWGAAGVSLPGRGAGAQGAGNYRGRAADPPHAPVVPEERPESPAGGARRSYGRSSK